jgi:FG-GAP repeat/Metallo-peptidase family M12/Fibronectin type III domain
MKNYFLLAACFLLTAAVSGQRRSDKQVVARIAAHKAVSTFTRFTPFAQTEAPALRDALIGAVVEDASFMVASVEALSGVLAQPPEQLTLEIPAEDGLIELDLVRADIYATGFSLVTASTNAAVEHVQGVHYRGIIAGRENSLAAISIFPDEVMGFVSDVAGNHVLGKLEGSIDEHIYYAERDLIDPPVFECHTSDEGDAHPIGTPTGQYQAKTARCVDLYWEVDHDIFLDKGGIANTSNYITGLFNQHATLFDNDGISVLLSQLFIWDVASPYTGNTASVLLGQFQSFHNGFNGDVGHLLDYTNDGGLAVFDGLCASDPDNRMCYSGINDSYSGVPVYSWSVTVVTHEEGHVLGSPHTHACVWNGDDTAIDGCGPSEGYPYEGPCGGAPMPADGGTIMSYCHLTPVGIDFNLGFGPQPAALIINNVDAAPCVGACGVAGCDMPTNITINALANSATVSWTAVVGATSYTLQWKPSGTAAWTTVAGITVTNHDLTGLLPAVTYSYRVLTECVGGTSAYSPVLSFTTLCTLGALCDDGDPFTEGDIIVSNCVCAGTPPTMFQEIEKVVASDRTEYDNFGSSVAISGDYAIVGAMNTDDTTAWNGGPGAAYIFARSGGTWIQQQKILPSEVIFDGEFGVSVAIDGDYAIVGAPNEGVDTGNWAYYAGSAYIFVRNGNTWIEQQRIVANDPGAYAHFGASVAISGDHAIVGAPFDDSNGVNSRGSAYTFVRTGNTWTQLQKLNGNNTGELHQFGTSVAMSGDYTIVGCPLYDTNGDRGAAFSYKWNGNTWANEQRIQVNPAVYFNDFGRSVAINGDQVIVGAPWEDEFGIQHVGAAYIFVRTGNTWTQQQRIGASDQQLNDYFGLSVGITGDHAIVGAQYEDHNLTGSSTRDKAGSAYVFVRSGTLWAQLQKVVASDRAINDQFGVSVAISGDHALVGAFMEDEDEFGNNTLSEAGSVYYLTNDTALMDNSTGLDLTHITTDLLVFPVPTSDVLNVVLPDTRAYRADVIGLDGRLVLPLGTMRSRTPVDVSTLTAGAYLLRLTSGAYDVRYVRFVKE